MLGGLQMKKQMRAKTNDTPYYTHRRTTTVASVQFVRQLPRTADMAILDLEGQIGFYAQYHNNPINFLCHVVGVPLILWSLYVWLASIGDFTTVGGYGVNLSTVGMFLHGRLKNPPLLHNVLPPNLHLSPIYIDFYLLVVVVLFSFFLSQSLSQCILALIIPSLLRLSLLKPPLDMVFTFWPWSKLLVF